MPNFRKSQLLALVLICGLLLSHNSHLVSSANTQAIILGGTPIELLAVPAIPIPNTTWQSLTDSTSTKGITAFAHEPEALPQTTAAAYVIRDIPSQTVLAAQNADQPLPPASTLKLMTALVALESFSPQTILTVQQSDLTWSNTIGLQPGEQLTVEDLLKCLLIASSNEAAEVLAREYPNGYQAFVARMNSYASELGLHSAYFSNPTGYDAQNQRLSSTDLLKLAEVAMQNTLIQSIVREPLLIVSDISNTQQHVLRSTNQLLEGGVGAVGIKTGTTDQAGEVLISQFLIENHQIQIVVMGSSDRYGDTRALLNWVLRTYRWIEPAKIIMRL